MLNANGELAGASSPLVFSVVDYLETNVSVSVEVYVPAALSTGETKVRSPAIVVEPTPLLALAEANVNG